MTDLKTALRTLHQRPIVYYRAYRDLTETTAGGVVLSQLLYMLSGAESPKIITDREIMAWTGVTPEELRGVKKRLKKLSFISVRVKGVPAKTHYKVDWEVLADSLGQFREIHETCFGKTPKPLMSTSCSCNKPIHSVGTATQVPTDSNKEADHPRWKSAAKRLHEAVKRVKKIDYSSHLPQWARSFRLLHEKDKVELGRIRVVLSWYCAALQDADPFLPVAHSAHSFRDKFLRIEDAMKRSKKTEEVDDREDQVPQNGLGAVARESCAELADAGYNVKVFDYYSVLEGLMGWLDNVCEKMGKEITQQKASNKRSPTRDVQEATLYVLRPSPVPLPRVYSEWIVKEVQSWTSWGGDMKQFHIGGKHWDRFLSHVRNRCGWSPSTKEKRIMNEATASRQRA